MIRVDAHHVRAVLWARSIGRGFKTGEPEHKTDQVIMIERTNDQAAIMDGSDKYMSWNYIRFAEGPYNALQSFYG
jgi:hypothetical protein